MGESASPAHRDEESSPAAAAAAATAAATTQPATAAAQQGGQAPDEQAKDTEQGDESDSGCPICRYIEAGPCGQEHKVLTGGAYPATVQPGSAHLTERATAHTYARSCSE